MTAAQIRDWLGKYFLLTTVILGGYILIFAGKGTPLLRVDSQTGMDCFQIIIPTLVAQLTTIFRFFAASEKIERTRVPLPSWVVKWPPLLALGLVIATIFMMALGNVGERGQPFSPDQAQFKLIVTFYITILNATTVFIIMRLFEAAGTDGNAPPRPPDVPPAGNP